MSKIQFLLLKERVLNRNYGFVLHHRCEQTLLALTAVDEASILIGPEGGLSEIEINQANQAGYRCLKKSPIGQKLDFANHPYLCKGLI
jgi:16S rRNA U1498 N3-methylase RsmE